MQSDLRAQLTEPFAQAATWVLALIGLACFALLGVLAVVNPLFAALGVGLVLAVGVGLVDATLLPMIAVPSLWLLSRVGPLSVSDLALFLATILALFSLKLDEAPEVRSQLWVVVFYQAALIPTVLSHRYQANYIEWVHEAFLIGGALIVGWVLGRHNHGPTSITIFMVLSCGVAIWAIKEAVAIGFEPVYLPTLHKNVIGDVLSVCVVIAYARPDWLGWSRKLAAFFLILCALGMAVSQSRQGIVGAAVGIIAVVVRGRQFGKRSKLVLWAMGVAMVVVYFAAKSQLASSNKFNSAYARLTAFDTSFQAWGLGRWFGAGLRWWYDSRVPMAMQPPNAEMEMLSSAGLLGAAAFIVAALASLWLLWKVNPRYGTLAFAVVLNRLAQGQLDVFWVATQSSACWIIAGICLGVLARERARSSWIGASGAGASKSGPVDATPPQEVQPRRTLPSITARRVTAASMSSTTERQTFSERPSGSRMSSDRS